MTNDDSADECGQRGKSLRVVSDDVGVMRKSELPLKLRTKTVLIEFNQP